MEPRFLVSSRFILTKITAGKLLCQFFWLCTANYFRIKEQHFSAYICTDLKNIGTSINIALYIISFRAINWWKNISCRQPISEAPVRNRVRISLSNPCLSKGLAMDNIETTKNEVPCHNRGRTIHIYKFSPLECRNFKRHAKVSISYISITVKNSGWDFEQYMKA